MVKLTERYLITNIFDGLTYFHLIDAKWFGEKKQPNLLFEETSICRISINWRVISEWNIRMHPNP